MYIYIYIYTYVNMHVLWSEMIDVGNRNDIYIYIYIYIYIFVCVCVCVEKSDLKGIWPYDRNMDKSNTWLRFRCVVFHLGFISYSRTSSRQRLFSEFFYLKACEESGGGIIIVEKFGRDLKTNVSGFIKDFLVWKWR